jgi:hypothetical protein
MAKKPEKPKIPQAVLEFFKKTGAKGGKSRAKNHTPEELSAWGKLGGRPKGKAKKQTKKGIK